MNPEIVQYPLGDNPSEARLYYGIQVIDALRQLPEGSVHTCVTSPPYWGLRDYGTATWVGGEQDCDHLAGSNYGTKSDSNQGAIRGGPFKQSCGKCGAHRIDQQIGLEDSPDGYTKRLVEVFQEVRRVLRDDGTLWLNLGDSYCTAPKGNRGSGINGERFGENEPSYDKSKIDGLRHKDLVGIPWRVAFALQKDGWYLRSDIIWSKPNPMPESVTDRPTKAHEYMFLLTKNERYYYDADAIKEPMVVTPHAPGNKKLDSSRNDQDSMQKVWGDPNGRNKRSVWHIATQPYAEAHFATFPEKLVEPCILAGTGQKGCCPKCGSSWERGRERTGHVNKRVPAHQPNNTPTKIGSTGWGPLTRPTNTWEPTCECEAGDPVPCVVLDPFSGSGTTGSVALQHKRNYVGIDLNPEYLPIAKARLLGQSVQKTEDADEGVLELFNDET